MAKYNVYFILKESIKNKLKPKDRKKYPKILKQVSANTKKSARKKAFSKLTSSQKRNYKYAKSKIIY